MKISKTAVAAATIMCCASILGSVIHPDATAAEKGNSVALEAIVPTSFKDWALLPDQGAQVVNPETKELLDKLYSQLLTRTYTNKEGYRIMLSLAYGDDQRGGLQAHRPEVCYPAQGFKVDAISDGTLATGFGKINVRRMTAELGARKEPVTYWMTFGDQVLTTDFKRRIAQIRLGLTGQIPDGLLFRISSIDADKRHAFDVQQQFVSDLLAATTASGRKKLSGLAATGA